MRTQTYYRDQAAGCRRLRDQVSEPDLPAAIKALAGRYDMLAILWSDRAGQA